MHFQILKLALSCNLSLPSVTCFADALNTAEYTTTNIFLSSTFCLCTLHGH